MPVFDQAHLHLVDATWQRTRVEGLQTGRHRLCVDQQALAIDLHGCLAVGRDIHRVHAGLGAVDRQAVGAAIHHAHCGVGAGTEGARFPCQAFGAGGEIAQAHKTALQFALGVELMHGVVGLVVRTAQTRQLHVEGLAPVAQAGAGLQAKTSAQVLILAAVEIDLVTYHQPAAAAFGLIVEMFGLAIALGIFGDDRQQRIFQVVVHRQHLFRALARAGAQRHTGLQDIGPGVTLTGAEAAFAGVGEIEQGHSVIAGQHNHRLAQRLLIEFNPHRQWNIKKMLLELRRQTFGLGQQTSRRVINGSGRRKCTAT